MKAKELEAEADTTTKLSVTPPAPAGFIDTAEMLRRVPVSPGTLQNWRKAGKIPFCRLTGRRVIWHWPSVEATLLRVQRGGTN